MKLSHRRVRLAAGVGLAILLACMMSASAMARPKIYKSVPTHVSFSATKAADGTITVEAIFTSPNPRCLEGKRFLQKRADGNYWVAGGTLYFGGAFTAPNFFNPQEVISEPFGFEGSAPPPNRGLLAPVSAAGKSPYVWQAIWPGSTELATTNFYDKSLPRHYEIPVGAASGVSLGAIARASKGQGLPYYKVAFSRHGKRIILKCGTLAEASSYTEIAF